MAKLAGRYQVLRELGRGGFGVTYLAADHLRPGHPHCVVKQLKPQPPPPPKLLPKIRQLFEQEAATLERLGKHPQIPQLLAHFEEQGDFYIVQEFIPGQTLGMELEAVNTLSEKAVVKLLQGGLEVLSFVHRQGVIHRDIKPDNLIREGDGSIYLIDFGAVKAFAASAAPQTQRLTTTMAIGTAGYMPDEQRRGKPLPASDVYALGMVAIEALTGKLPTELDTDPHTGEVVWRKWVQIDDGIAAVLTQMVRHHYSRRYGSAKAALAALAAAVAPPPPPRPSAPKAPAKATTPAKAAPSPARTRRGALQRLGSYGMVAAGIAVARILERWFGRQPLPSPSPAPTDTLPSLSSTSFEVVTVNDQGEIDNRRTTEAQFFTEDLGNGVILEMMAIPGGEFTMGSPEYEEGRDLYEILTNVEGPQRRVTVPTFFMGRYVVTQAQYQAIMGGNPSQFSENGAKRPVERVSWLDATAFCERLSELTGLSYRLPSEAEWEYACRARTETPFHFGPTITTEIANYRGIDVTSNDQLFPGSYSQGPKGIYRKATTEVGSFRSNSFGLYDMHGNVWEWCQDVWHDSYEGAPPDGTAWLTGDNQDKRLLRGGSWNSAPRACRSACRLNHELNVRSNLFGFRVVCSPTRTPS